jgi:hypothetical protein
VRFLVSELTRFAPNFFDFTLLITIQPLLHPLRYEIALNRQHVIISSVFKCGASSLIRYVAGYNVRKLYTSLKTVCFVTEVTCQSEADIFQLLEPIFRKVRIILRTCFLQSNFDPFTVQNVYYR